MRLHLIRTMFPALLLPAALLISSTSYATEVASSAKAKVTTIKAPISFEPAADQEFIAHRPGAGVRFTQDSIETLLPGQHGRAAGLTMKLHGRSALRIRTEGELPGKSNYLKGNDPARWRTNVPTFARLRYSRVYPGIDLVFYGTGDDLEHDFIVEAGADPKQINLELQGAKKISLNARGDLLIQMEGGDLALKKPVAYQEVGGTRREVFARFALSGNHLSFVLGNYNREQRLIIDPVLSFGTFLGGSSFDQINGMAVDAAGNIYVTGSTGSPDFPVHLPEQPTCLGAISVTGCGDAFITKFDPTGSTLIYSTFLGGNGLETALSIAVDANGNAIVAGFTGEAPDFPTVNPIVTGIAHGWFVTSLSANGASLNYSGVYNPDPQSSSRTAVTVDSSGNAYLTGQSDGGGILVTPGAVGGLYAPHTLFVVKLNPSGAVVYSGVVRGTSATDPNKPFPFNKNNFTPSTIVVDNTGAAYIAGTAVADDLPVTTGAIGATFGGRQGFAVKINPAGSAIAYATYIPGSTTAAALAVDSSGNAFLGGNAAGGLPTSANAFRKTVNSDGGYILKMGPAATNVAFASYLGGDTTGTSINEIAVGPAGNLYVAGSTFDFNFPFLNPLQRFINSGTNFVAMLNSDASGLLFSTVLGGNGTADVHGFAVDSAGKITVAGTTNAHNFPTTSGSFQPVFPAVPTAAETHGMVAKIDPNTPAGELCMASAGVQFGTVLVNTSAQQPLTLINCGNADLHVSGVSVASPAYTVSANCATIPPDTACTGTITYSPTVVAVDNALLTFQHDGGLPNGVSNISAPTIVVGAASLNPPPTVIISGTSVATLKSGGTATYNLVVTPKYGFTGTLSLGCLGPPRFSTCSIPSSVTLSGSPANFTVTVNTTTPAANNRAPGAGADGMAFACVFAPFALIIVARRRKKRLPVLFAGILVLLMASCGGGNNPVTVPPPPPGTTPPGIYYPTVTTNAGGQTLYALTMIVQ
ncbi:MAG: SBBP repeat-containing protein [Acidobacteriia bacterium]|nr:SBBP repeat-containing protein [Terriglobia bacterium]